MHKILIVDDSTTMRRMVAASLRTLQDVELEEATSGLEAIERLSLFPASLMILDLNMPDMHGLDVLRFVRSQRTGRTLPIVVLTTRNDWQREITAMMSALVASRDCDFLTVNFRKASPHFSATVDSSNVETINSSCPTRTTE